MRTELSAASAKILLDARTSPPSAVPSGRSLAFSVPQHPIAAETDAAPVAELQEEVQALRMKNHALEFKCKLRDSLRTNLEEWRERAEEAQASQDAASRQADEANETRLALQEENESLVSALRNAELDVQNSRDCEYTERLQCVRQGARVEELASELAASRQELSRWTCSNSHQTEVVQELNDEIACLRTEAVEEVAYRNETSKRADAAEKRAFMFYGNLCNLQRSAKAQSEALLRSEATRSEASVALLQSPRAGETIASACGCIADTAAATLCMACNTALVSNEPPSNWDAMPVPITDRLLLGGKPSSSSRARLACVDVGLTLASDADKYSPADYGERKQIRRPTGCTDLSKFNLLTHVKEICTGLKELDNMKMVTYIHCDDGVNKSAACVIAYRVWRTAEEHPAQFQSPASVLACLPGIWADVLKKRRHVLVIKSSMMVQLYLWCFFQFDTQRALNDGLYTPLMFLCFADDVARGIVKQVLKTKAASQLDLNKNNISSRLLSRHLLGVEFSQDATGSLKAFQMDDNSAAKRLAHAFYVKTICERSRSDAILHGKLNKIFQD